MLSDYTHLRKEYPRTWRVWYRMCKRCNLPQKGYADIAVYEDWDYFEVGSAGFINFLDDMGPMEDMEYEIIRDDAFGDYAPGNCKWRKTAKRMMGRRWHKTKRAELLKKARANGLNRHTFYGRMERGWNEEDAVSLPVSSLPYKSRII
jgi:hypothetical protein